MKDLIFFLESTEDEYITPLNIGYLYLNRLTIDEDAAFEVIGVHELSRSKGLMLEKLEENFETLKDKSEDLKTEDEINDFISEFLENLNQIFGENLDQGTELLLLML